MNGHGYPTVVKKHSFLASLAIGLSVVLVSAIFMGGLVTLYGMSIVDRRLSGGVEAFGEIVERLPEIAEGLPPVLGDILHHERDPDYREALDVDVSLLRSRSHGRDAIKPVVEVKNEGGEVVALLSMRCVVQSREGTGVVVKNLWAATPIACDDPDWCGPLMPHSTRRVFGPQLFLEDGESIDDVEVDVEVTDVRVWRPRDGGRRAEKALSRVRLPGRAVAEGAHRGEGD